MKKVCEIKIRKHEMMIEITKGDCRFNCRQINPASTHPTIDVIQYALICSKLYKKELENIKGVKLKIFSDNWSKPSIVSYPHDEAYHHKFGPNLVLKMTRAWKVSSSPDENELNLSFEEMKGLIEYSEECMKNGTYPRNTFRLIKVQEEPSNTVTKSNIF